MGGSIFIGKIAAYNMSFKYGLPVGNAVADDGAAEPPGFSGAEHGLERVWGDH